MRTLLGDSDLRLRAGLDACRQSQEAALARILRRNRNTWFGRQHDFAAIDGVAAYQSRVPVCDYEDLAPALERVRSGEADVLFAGPATGWELTGGSRGGRRLIPSSPEQLGAFRSALTPWLADVLRHEPGITTGRMYWPISPPGTAMPERGGSDVTYISDAAYFGPELATALSPLLAVGPEVLEAPDLEAWRDLTCLTLLAAADLTLISVWSPTYLAALLDHIEARFDSLLKRLGAAAPWPGLPRHPESASTARKRRAEALRAAAGLTGIDWRLVWPDLRLVSAWDDGVSGTYAHRLRTRLPGVGFQGKGLLATEGVVTVPLHGVADPVLASTAGFFEFIESGASRPRGLPAWQLDTGGRYEVVLTTSGGLYRYRLGDEIRVTGRVGDTPTMRFVGRAGVTADFCGEKLTEAFVAATLGGLPGPAALGADPAADGGRPGYILLLEAGPDVTEAQCRIWTERTETGLRANPQYESARALGQLAPLRSRLVTDLSGRWQRAALRRGQGLGQIKPPGLIADSTRWRELLDEPV